MDLIADLCCVVQHMKNGIVTITSHAVNYGNGIEWTIQGPNKNLVVILRYEMQPLNKQDGIRSIKAEPRDDFIADYRSRDNGAYFSHKNLMPSVPNLASESTAMDNSELTHRPLDVALRSDATVSRDVPCRPEPNNCTQHGQNLNTLNVEGLRTTQDSNLQQSFFNASDEKFAVDYESRGGNLENHNEQMRSQEMLELPCEVILEEGLHDGISCSSRDPCFGPAMDMYEADKACRSDDFNRREKCSLPLAPSENVCSVSNERRISDAKEPDVPGEDGVACLHCGKKFSSLAYLKLHERYHEGGKESYSCALCEKLFSSLENLKIHEKFHTGERPYQCGHCDKNFPTLAQLKMHEAVHSGQRPYQCSHCPQSFSRSSHLKRHERLHTGEKPYQCTLCELAFTRVDHLKRHERLHLDEMPHRCSLCDKNFVLLDDLKVHERVHLEDKSYQCPQCPETFSRSGHLKRHERLHTGEKPYQCPHCELAFMRVDHLKRHERSHVEEAPQQCSLCDKFFASQIDLKMHEKVHLQGTTSHPCSQCPEVFARNDQLRRHEDAHTGRRPYQCSQCDQRFTRSGHLRRHERLHTGERPYRCSHCDQTFLRGEHLKRHEQIHNATV